MPSPTLVAPLDENLLARLGGRRVVVRTVDPAAVIPARDAAEAAGCEVSAVLLETKATLSTMEFPSAWQGIPLAIHPRAFGRFRDLAPRLKDLSSLDARVCLPATEAANLVGLRILSALGIPGCADLCAGDVDWEALTDLATFAILERNEHAPIDPFSFVAQRYEPGENLAWQRATFDDPAAYLHLDEEGRAALTRKDLAAGRFFTREVAELQTLDENEAYGDALFDKHEFFLNDHSCARCEGWRVCLGAFATDGEPPEGCADFGRELLELAEEYRTLRAGKEVTSPWRP